MPYYSCVINALTQVQDSAKAIVEFAHSHLWTYMVGHLIVLQNSRAFLNAHRMQSTFDLMILLTATGRSSMPSWVWPPLWCGPRAASLSRQALSSCMLSTSSSTSPGCRYSQFCLPLQCHHADLLICQFDLCKTQLPVPNITLWHHLFWPPSHII